VKNHASGNSKQRAKAATSPTSKIYALTTEWERTAGQSGLAFVWIGRQKRVPCETATFRSIVPRGPNTASPPGVVHLELGAGLEILRRRAARRGVAPTPTLSSLDHVGHRLATQMGDAPAGQQ
jgi:hypothetical protein